MSSPPTQHLNLFQNSPSLPSLFTRYFLCLPLFVCPLLLSQFKRGAFEVKLVTLIARRVSIMGPSSLASLVINLAILSRSLQNANPMSSVVSIWWHLSNKIILKKPFQYYTLSVKRNHVNGRKNLTCNIMPATKKLSIYIFHIIKALSWEYRQYWANMFYCETYTKYIPRKVLLSK